MDYYIGQDASFSKTISESDVYLFAGLTGDFNEVHVNKIRAQESRFKGRVVHGALVASFISTVLGCYLPGPGTIYLSQTSNFLKPVRIGDTITARVVVLELIGRKAVFETNVYNQNEECVLEGRANVLLPD